MLGLTAKDIMTREVVTTKRGASIDEALRLMAEHGVSGLPVVDADGCLEGIITESDVLLKGQGPVPEGRRGRNPLFAPRPEGVDEAQRRAQSRLVEEAMTRKVLTFTEESLVTDIARAMVEHAINRMPIVDGCRLVGIVSRKDVVSAMAREANGVIDEDEVRTGRLIELS